MPVQQRKLGSQALFGGRCYVLPIEGWKVSWESLGPHRLWCYQTREYARHVVCVVMFNPGSLSGDGRRLAQDDTLRIIRNATPDSAATLVLNLFTLASPTPADLFRRWGQRKCHSFDLAAFRSMPIDAVVFAHGDIGQSGKWNRRYGAAVRRRIDEFSTALVAIPRVNLPTILMTRRGNPKHPKHWKLLGLLATVRETLRAGLSCVG